MPHKIPQSVLNRWASSKEKCVNRFGSFRKIDYLCTRCWVINGCWLSIRCSLMQFIAECGIEYGCQFVTLFSSHSTRLLLYKEKLIILTELRKNERNAKGKLAFLFISECPVSSAKPKLHKKADNSYPFRRINVICLLPVSASRPCLSRLPAKWSLLSRRIPLADLSGNAGRGG